MRWYQFRLWVVAFAFFAGGLIVRIGTEIRGDVASTYGTADVQFCAYAAGLGLLCAWYLFQAKTSREQSVGCIAIVIVAIISAIALVSTVPR